MKQVLVNGLCRGMLTTGYFAGTPSCIVSLAPPRRKNARRASVNKVLGNISSHASCLCGPDWLAEVTAVLPGKHVVIIDRGSNAVGRLARLLDDAGKTVQVVCATPSIPIVSPAVFVSMWCRSARECVCDDLSRVDELLLGVRRCADLRKYARILGPLDFEAPCWLMPTADMFLQSYEAAERNEWNVGGGDLLAVTPFG
jgi:hypothetical protein